MAAAAARAGSGTRTSVAVLFARKVGNALLQNFLAKELVIEIGGDIFAFVKQKLVVTIFAESSPLPDKPGKGVQSGSGKMGIFASEKTVGQSVSSG